MAAVDVSGNLDPPPAYDDASLVLSSDTTLAMLTDPLYWVAICPWLHVSRDTQREVAAVAAAASAAVALSSACQASREEASPVTEMGAAATPAATASATAAATSAATPASTAAATAAAAPWASIGGGPAALAAELRTRGYFSLPASSVAHLPGASGQCAAALDRGVCRLVALGHAPSAICAYDEAWALAAALLPLVSAATGNGALGDWTAFSVSSLAHAFAGPHRDKPCAGAESFRADGAPCYETVWVALSHASPTNSCLYFVDADRDPGYRASGDAVREALPGPSAWPGITAQPCEPGGVLVFSHRLLHWGSDARGPLPGATEAPQPPRTALSFAVADRAFAPPLFDAGTFTPFPPLALRVALRAGQAIFYHSQAPLSRAQLALDRRAFASGARYFSGEYADRVLSDAQMIAFSRSESDRHTQPHRRK